jgi:hypothetical protein
LSLKSLPKEAARGNQIVLLTPKGETGAKRYFMVDAGNFFFPSPAANLVSYGEEGHEKVLPF